MFKLGQKIRSTIRLGNRLLPLYYSTNKKSRSYYIKHWDHSKVIANTILYEVRDGQSITDSPLYIYLYLVQHDEYHSFEHFWVVKSGINKEKLLINVPSAIRPFVKFVVRDSLEYSKLLLTANYVITNSTFNFFWHKRPGQIYINTWHGTPLKYMGYDIPGNKTSLKNVQRNLLMADYIISPNMHTTHVFFDCYKLRGLYKGKILETGYPRNDILQNKDGSVIDDLKAEGIKLDNRKIVLYTPTWKGTFITNPTINLNQIMAEVDYLQYRHPDVQILVKVHPYAYSQAANHEKLKDILVPDYFDANRVLSVTDILITDYSSIFFDFQITHRPIIFYAWDKEQYDYYRGMYLEDKQLPGNVFTDISDVSEELTNLYFDKSKYNESIKRMSPYDDGESTERIVKRIFDKNISPQIKEISNYNNIKKKLLIFAGGMKNNGISSSLINLTHNLDFEKLDVSVLVYDGRDKDKVRNISLLDKRVRLIYIMGTPGFSIAEHIADKIIGLFGIRWWNSYFYPKKAYQRETHRLFGHNEFDTVIDFSGYSYNGAKLIAESNAKKKIIFQHNDLLADAYKEIKGKKPNYRNLIALFSLYYKFDKVVSVSEQLMEINKQKLNKYLKNGQVDYLKNTLHFEQKDDIAENAPNIEDISQGVLLKEKSSIAASTIHDLLVNNFVDVTVENETFRAVSKVKLGDEEYVRLTKDDIPWFWMNIKFLIFIDETNVVVKKEKVDRIGWIKKNSKYLWNNVSLMDMSDIVGRAWLIQYSFIKVLNKITTNHGIYLEVLIPGRKSSVYLWAGSVQILGNNHFTFLQKIWNLLFSKRTESHFEKKIQTIQIKKGALLYAQPPGLLRQFNKSLDSVSQTLQFSTAWAEVRGILYYRIGSGKNSKWVSGADVSIFNQHINFMNLNINLMDVVLSKDFTIQPSKDIILKANNFGNFMNGMQIILEIFYVKSYFHVLYDENLKKIQIVKNDVTDDKGLSIENTESKSITAEQYLEIVKKDTVDYSSLDVVKSAKKLPVSSFFEERSHQKIEPENTTQFKLLNSIVQENSFIFSTIGRFSPEKNQIMLLQAFDILVQNNKNLFLVMMGEGPLQSDLKKIINYLKLEKNVLLLGQVKNPYKVLKRTDAFVLSSAYEGQPMVLLEAMSFGLPIVATNIATNANVLENQDFGLLTNDFSAQSLAESMRCISSYHYDFKKFNIDSYNKEVMNKFHRLIT